MSFFPELFKSYGRYKLIVNKHGEISLSLLDANGVEISTCCGCFEDVFISAYQKSHPEKTYVFCNVAPHDFDCKTWEELCDKLNSGKKCKSRMLWKSMHDFRWASPIEWDDKVGKFIVKSENNKL